MRKLGQALKQVVSERSEAEEGGAAKSALMNANRRRVFEYVAWHPCATAGEVARAIRVGGPTAAWHFAKLVEAGYIQASRHGRRRLFHVAGLGLDASDVSGLAALAEPRASDVLTLVVESPGLTATDLADKIGTNVRRAVRLLADARLVASVADGRYRRYYPGPALGAIERTAPKRLRTFRRQLLRMLASDRLAPEARAAPGDVLEIDVRFGDVRATIRVPTESLLAGRLG